MGVVSEMHEARSGSPIALEPWYGLSGPCRRKQEAAERVGTTTAVAVAAAEAVVAAGHSDLSGACILGLCD